MKAARKSSIRLVKSTDYKPRAEEKAKKISFHAKDQYRTASERRAGGKALRWTYVRISGQALARAHARSDDAAMISASLSSSEIFNDAIGEFAIEYADQNVDDYRAFARAVREGRGRSSSRILVFHERRNCRRCLVRKIAGKSCDR
jgi:Uncharacterized protein conserved in bacteria (DUF2252)